MIDTSYAKAYRGIDFRSHPELYRVGLGERGVLIAEPYKSEIGPHWRFRTLAIARTSSATIYRMFLEYLREQDFVGADMARKYLQMGWTRARRYANHSSGLKYDRRGNVRPIEADCMESEKAQCAQVFKVLYDKARRNPSYQRLKKAHDVRTSHTRAKNNQ